MEKNIKLLEIIVKLKEKQLKKVEYGVEYWEITFQGNKFLTAYRHVSFFCDSDTDPSNMILHDEIESMKTKLIYTTNLNKNND